MIQSMQITMFQILTIGGTIAWNESSSLHLEHDILEPNGIYIKGSPIKKKDAYFCCVDTDQTIMGDFYKWEELPKEDKETFCWRTFYIIGDAASYRSWLPIPDQEQIRPYSCRELFDSIYEVI